MMEGHLNPRFDQCRLKAITGATLDYDVEPMHHLPANPMRYVKHPKVEKKPRERIILTLEEWQQIIGKFPAGSRYHIPLMIGFYTGLRISEAFALTWDDIDLENRTLSRVIHKELLFAFDYHSLRHPYVKHKTKSFLRNSRVFKADFCAPSHSLCTEVFHFPDNINLISGVNIHTFNQCVSQGGI